MQNDEKINVESINLFDEEEIIHNCTVHILRNSVTGEISIGWWPEDNPPEGMKMQVRYAYV